MVKDYGVLLAQDPAYADKAARIAALARDPGEVLAAEMSHLEARLPGAGRKIAFHSPCSLQHGQQLPGLVEGLLVKLGYELTLVRDSHLCCGSAGSYSLLQPELSRRLRDEKLANLTAGDPACIATANVGCQLHLETGTRIPVRHWLELVDEILTPGSGAQT